MLVRLLGRSREGYSSTISIRQKAMAMRHERRATSDVQRDFDEAVYPRTNMIPPNQRARTRTQPALMSTNPAPSCSTGGCYNEWTMSTSRENVARIGFTGAYSNSSASYQGASAVLCLGPKYLTKLLLDHFSDGVKICGRLYCAFLACKLV